MKWSEIIKEALDQLEKNADDNSLSLKAELQKQLSDKELIGCMHSARK